MLKKRKKNYKAKITVHTLGTSNLYNSQLDRTTAHNLLKCKVLKKNNNKVAQFLRV